MKKYIFLPLSILGTSLFAQFSVNGQIENYQNKPVIVKIFDNGLPKSIQNTKTDAAGNFTAKVPVNYNGIVKIDLPSGGSLDLLSENENIKFKTVYGQTMQQDINIIEGKAQKEFIHVLTQKPLNELSTSVFPYIKNIYKPTDTFYKAIEAEEKRINSLNNQTYNSELVKYIQGLEVLATNAKTNADEATINQILNHIQKDDDRLEHSGYMSDLIYGYMNHSFNNGQKDSPENNLIKATDILLEKGNIETERGQNILSILFTIVPEDNFPNFYAKYKQKVNGLTCKVTEDLKSKVKNTSIKIGDKAPNITFDTAVKGKKSLYDIKANQKLVVFWASWCPACMKEMPFIKEYYNEFKKNGGEIVAISLDYDQNEFNNATKDFGWYNYTDLLRWDSPIAEKFNVNSTPTIFLLDKDNKIIQKVGHINELIANK